MRFSRGFFSIFLGAFAIALVIGFLYAQSTQVSIQSKEEQLYVAQQQISKEWSLARNVYVNFASDAILNAIEFSNGTSLPPSSTNCTAAWANVDFGGATGPVPQYWNTAYNYMKDHFGVDCRATLSAAAHNTIDTPHGLNREPVLSDQRAYALLSCTKKVGQVDLNYIHPFVIKKRITVIGGVGFPCTVSVYDVLGSDPGLSGYNYNNNPATPVFPPVPYQYRDVNKTFP